MVLEPARTRPTSNDWTGDYRQARLRGLTPLDEIGAGDRIFVSSACAEPVTVIADLTRRAESGRLRDVTSYMILGGSTGSLLGAARQGHRVLAMAASTKQASDFFPWTMYQTADLMRSGELCFDVAIVQTTMPDQHGYMSLGVSADFARQAVAQARVVIAEANPRMPYTGGGNHVHTSQLDGIVEVPTELVGVDPDARAGDARKVVAADERLPGSLNWTKFGDRLPVAGDNECLARGDRIHELRVLVAEFPLRDGPRHGPSVA